MKKILLIQSRERPDTLLAEQRGFRREVPLAVQLDFLSALDTSHDWNTPASIVAGYDALMFGGSGEFDLHGNRDESDAARKTARDILSRLQPLIAHIILSDFPTFGVCFGHQLIAEAQGGNIVSDADQKKTGSFEVMVTEIGAQDSLFASTGASFVAQYAHRDSVTSQPRGSALLASGVACRFSALRYGEHVYTTQFHPELTRADMLERFTLAPGYLPDGVDPESIVRDSSVASTLIRSFVENIA